MTSCSLVDDDHHIEGNMVLQPQFLLWIWRQYIPSTYVYVFLAVSFLLAFPSILYMHSAYPPHVVHVLPCYSDRSFLGFPQDKSGISHIHSCYAFRHHLISAVTIPSWSSRKSNPRIGWTVTWHSNTSNAVVHKAWSFTSKPPITLHNILLTCRENGQLVDWPTDWYAWVIHTYQHTKRIKPKRNKRSKV
jgi:hypothetical protein